MVGKLIKHEMIAYMRTLLPMQLILLGIALVSRIVQFFESDTIAYNTSFASSIVIYVIAIIVLVIMTAIVGITRFYKNLFTSEGYLSFTLPVTSGQHIFTKLLVSFIFSAISLVTILISVFIITSGDVLVEIFKAIGYAFKQYFNFTGSHGIFYIIEVIILIAIAVVSSYLLYYTCIAIGQLSKKNKILLAFGVYFGYYVACQIIGTIFTIFIAVLSNSQIAINIGNFIAAYPFETVHITLVISILFTAVMCLIYYLITHHIINKKLNLE